MQLFSADSQWVIIRNMLNVLTAGANGKVYIMHCTSTHFTQQIIPWQFGVEKSVL